jgi:DNA-directed RNA polymerase beta' subunit
MGKRCEQTGRTVIGPDPTLRMGQLALPPEMASNLTFPESITPFNIEKMSELVNNGKANFVIREKEGKKTRINLHYALYSKGTELLYGDVILRNEKEMKIGQKLCRNFELKPGDIIKRNGNILENITYPKKKKFILQIGDIVERHLRDGDVLLLNRQPRKFQ